MTPLLRWAARFLAACVALAPVGLRAQGQPLPLVHPAEPPLEQYSPWFQVGSDGIVVGIEAAGAPGNLPLDQLVAYLPPGNRDSLCVSVRSIDGKYRGTFHFAAPGARTRVLLDVRSRLYPSELASYTADRLAVSAWLAPSCAAAPESFVVVGRSRAAPGGAVRLSLNANAGLLVRADIISPGPALPSTWCPPLELEDAHAFNRVCTIPLPTAAGRYDLRVAMRIPGQNPQFKRYAVRVP